jgi:pantoate--beta-alanine ligase
MTRDLNWNIEIIGHPIVREADGLAMSSRNSYLSGEERRSALYLSQAINHARKSVGRGLTDPVVLMEELQDLAGSFPGVAVEYINFVDRENLEDVGVVVPGTILALAAKVGRTRLIDNALIFENC